MRTLVAIALCLAALPAIARADAIHVALPDDPDLSPVAIDLPSGVVVQAMDRERRGVDIVRRDPGAPPVALAHLDDPAATVNTHWLGVAVSSTAWAVTVQGEHQRFSGDLLKDILAPVRPIDEVVATGPVAGGAPRVLASCRFRPRPALGQLRAVVAGGAMAFSGSHCPGATGVRYAPPGGPVRVVSGRGEVATMSSAALVYLRGDDATLLDTTSGAAAEIVPYGPFFEDSFAFDTDGTLVAFDRPGPLCAGPCPSPFLRVAADGSATRFAPIGRAVDRRFATYTDSVVAGGGRAVLHGRLGQGFAAVDLATGAATYAGYGGPVPTVEPIAVDATRAAWTTRNCMLASELVIDRTVPEPPHLPAAPPCPVLFGARRLRVHAGAVRVPVRCPNGCEDDVDLVAGGRTIATDIVLVRPGGTSTLYMRLDRRGRALLDRSGRIAARLVVEQDVGDVPIPPAAVTVSR